jgi:hypothetical protein
MAESDHRRKGNGVGDESSLRIVRTEVLGIFVLLRDPQKKVISLVVMNKQSHMHSLSLILLVDISSFRLSDPEKKATKPQPRYFVVRQKAENTLLQL